MLQTDVYHAVERGASTLRRITKGVGLDPTCKPQRERVRSALQALERKGRTRRVQYDRWEVTRCQ